MKNIYIIGIGMGNPQTITIAGAEAIRQSHVLIGAKRMTDSFGASKITEHCIAADEIMKAIEAHEEKNCISVLMSGDLGFFSGAEKLRKLFEKKYGSVFGNEDLKIEYIAGISSLSYLSSKIGISWEDANIVSLHGREENAVAQVYNHRKTFFLTDGKENTVRNICKRLTDSGFGGVELYTGERLSYEDEVIRRGSAREFSNIDFEPLSVMLVLNEDPFRRSKDTLGTEDDAFIRGNVPMTKEEIRTLAVSKLNLKETDIVYDIGAGTGSVSVEAALTCRYGAVYAIETNEDGIDLIERNKEKFKLKNLLVKRGMAPEALTELPMPQKAFIGGSKGNLDTIIEVLLAKNKDIRIVTDVVTLESLAEAVACIKKYGFQHTDITQVNIAKAKALGNYNLMMGQNPVYIIAMQGL